MNEGIPLITIVARCTNTAKAVLSTLVVSWSFIKINIKII